MNKESQLMTGVVMGCIFFTVYYCSISGDVSSSKLRIPPPMGFDIRANIYSLDERNRRVFMTKNTAQYHKIDRIFAEKYSVNNIFEISELGQEIAPLKQNISEIIHSIKSPNLNGNNPDNIITAPKSLVPIRRRPDGSFDLPQRVNPDAPKIIVLVNSLGRSGSSWIGELLSSSESNIMYVFEPLNIVRVIQNFSIVNSEQANAVMKNVLTCNYTTEFTNFHRIWSSVFQKFPDYCPKTEDCYSPESLVHRCHMAKTIVVKTIRMHLSDVRTLIENKDFRHMKVIFLSRDPRAQMMSRSSVFKVKTKSYEYDCNRIESDVDSFQELSASFPGQFYFLRYEDICRDYKVEATSLWRFLRNDPLANLPGSWLQYLTSHQKQRINHNPYNLYRNTEAEWYKWRTELKIMSPTYLSDLQEKCKNVMNKLGYIPLDTLDEAQNLSIPFLKNVDCNYWKCDRFKL